MKPFVLIITTKIWKSLLKRSIETFSMEQLHLINPIHLRPLIKDRDLVNVALFRIVDEELMEIHGRKM